MSASFYKLLHYLGIFMVLLAMGAVLASPTDERRRKLAGLTHGLGLLIVLVAGFGLLAKLGVGFDIWVTLKLLIWVAFGGLIVVVRKFPQHATLLWWGVIVLAFAAAYLGHYKPF